MTFQQDEWRSHMEEARDGQEQPTSSYIEPEGVEGYPGWKDTQGSLSS